MSELLWWAIFLVPTLLAVAWALWRSGPSGDTFHSVAAHRRFVEALSRTATEPIPAEPIPAEPIPTESRPTESRPTKSPTGGSGHLTDSPDGNT